MERHIEEMTLNAWPSMQSMVYDGWLLRFGRGYTRRANSVSVLYPSSVDFAEKIKRCEQLYNSKGLAATFKLMNKACPAGLDKLLEELGYVKEADTSVRLLELEGWGKGITPELVVYENLEEGWFKRLCAINEVKENNIELLRCILSGIVPERYFAELVLDGEVIGCGVGVLEDDYIGLFDIVIKKAYRGRGYGRKLMEAMLSAGRSKGARHAYLQVMLDNAPAYKLYESLGFKELYQYWYRVKNN